MKSKAIMVQGTGSHVGKSIIATALCRYYSNLGLKVAPFKAQNMALNAFVTGDGQEIGWAQAVQAKAARSKPEVHMNPVLLKPTAEDSSQVIYLGKAESNMTAKEYFSLKDKTRSIIAESLTYLRQKYDLIVIEGGGSPAEVNLREFDLVNMETARLAGAPVLLVADIDRGGVFAYLVGTMDLLEPAEREQVAGFIINKFRGNIERLTPGLEELEKIIEKPFLGVLPYLEDILLPQEDSLSLEEKSSSSNEGFLEVAVIKLAHISNFSDFDPLNRQPGLKVKYVSPGNPLGDPDIIIIPGTKNTIFDLKKLKETRTAVEIQNFAQQGNPVIGICGGYQMLGEEVLDPNGVEGLTAAEKGLGLLPISTKMESQKITRQVTAHLISSGEEINGYEIHMGRTNLHFSGGPFLAIAEKEGKPRLCGCINNKGNVWGCYLHGIFDNDNFRTNLLNDVAQAKGLPLFKDYQEELEKEKVFNYLAKWLEENLDMDYINSLIL